MPLNGQPRIRPAEFSYASGDIEPEHSHDDHQFVYASHGLLCVDTETSRWVVPPLRAVWVPAGTPHVVTAKADSVMSTLYIDPSSPPALAGHVNVLPDHVTVVSVTPLLRELVRHIHDHPPSGAERRRLEDVILDQITSAQAAPLAIPRLRDPRVRAIAEAFDRNPRDDRTLRQFGREVGASERTLQRLFVAETGTSFGRWRTQVRLQHGVIALGRGMSVATAALTSGYSEPSAFIAAFRSAFGTTPSRYFAEA